MSITKASYALAALRQADPPPQDGQGKPVDRVAPLFHLVAQNVPAWATDQYKSGKLVFGEVGMRKPDAFAEHFPDGSHAISITSGYVRLVYASASEFAAQLMMTADGVLLKPSLSTMDAAIRTASLLDQYRIGLPAGGYALDVPRSELSPEQQSRAVQLTDAALLLTFLHELGHVSTRLNNLATPNNSEEQAADVFAFTMLLSASQRLALAWTYAGALFALRIHDCLEKAGYDFRDKTASFRSRLEWLQGGIRSSLARMSSTREEIAWVEAVMEQFFHPVEAAMQLLRLSIGPPEGAAKRKLSGGNQAREAMTALRKNYPPWEFDKDGKPIDRTQWLLSVLELPNKVKEELALGQLVIGELGYAEPTSKVEKFPDGSKAILLSSGLFALLQGAARFLHLRVKVRNSPTEETGSVVTQEGAVVYIARLLTYHAQGRFNQATISFTLPGFWEPEELEWYYPKPQPLTDAQEVLASQLYVGAGAFLLLSHVFEALSERSPDTPTVGVGNAGEVWTKQFSQAPPEAIGAAFATVLLASEVPRLGFRRTYAAILFATWIRRCLGLMRGVPSGSWAFGPEQVKNCAWNAWGAGAVHSLKAIGDGYEALMGQVEQVLVRGSAALSDTDVPPIVADIRAEERAWGHDCVAPWISGGLYRCVVVSDVSKEELLAGVLAAIRSMTEEGLEGTAEGLFDDLAKKLKLPAHRPEHADAEKQLEVLDWLISKLPGEARSVFCRTQKRKVR